VLVDPLEILADRTEPEHRNRVAALAKAGCQLVKTLEQPLRNIAQARPRESIDRSLGPNDGERSSSRSAVVHAGALTLRSGAGAPNCLARAIVFQTCQRSVTRPTSS
jgi:hypothetical protein